VPYDSAYRVDRDSASRESAEPASGGAVLAGAVTGQAMNEGCLFLHAQS
jgi:hypothetical protein